MLASPRMVTGQLWRPAFAGAGHDEETLSEDHPPGPEVGPSRAPGALIVALLLVVLYAAFAHGADSDPAEARVQVGLSVVAILGGVGWLWSGTIRVGARSKALAGLTLLAAFAAWNGLTLLWSVAPNQTWLELNREISYVMVLVLALAAGASHRRPLQTVATGYLLVALAVTLYALGQKAVPGLHIGGLFDLNQTTTFARLQAPLDYWNALALFVVFAVPIALVIAVDPERPRRIRMASLMAVELMLLVIGLTYSRGGILVLVVAVAVSVAFGGAWLRTLMLLGAAAVATALPLAIALSVHSLSAANVPLGDRGVAGAEFTLALLLSLLALFAAARKLLDRNVHVELTRERVRRLARPLIAGVGVLAVIVVIVLALSSRGLGGSISHAWQTFTTPHTTENVNAPNISASSGNRWVWWKEAVGAWSDRPFGGWGAGSFQSLDLLYRTNGNIGVQDAHSVPLEWLAETGLVGGLLAIGGYGLLLAGGVDAVRRKTGAERAFGAALLAGGVAYAVHSFWDWDWDMPGATYPVLVFLGVLAGSGIGRRAARRSQRPAAARGSALAVCTFVLCIYTLSAVLPSLSASKASSALTQAGATSSRTQLQQAEATAVLASRLDPLSAEGLRAAASISVSLGHRGQARLYLLQAVRRDPSDVLAWEDLATLELRLRELRATRQALARVLELDPHGMGGPLGRRLMLELEKLSTPPNDSASATSTPLPVG
jgi:hypothetical protein